MHYLHETALEATIHTPRQHDLMSSPEGGPGALLRAARAVAAWWNRLGLDERSLYLSRSADLIELENRIRAYDRLPYHRPLA